MHTIAFILISIASFYFLSKKLGKWIHFEEEKIIESAMEIQKNRTQIKTNPSRDTLLFSIVACTLFTASYLKSDSIYFISTATILVIASYIDIKRNWVPDEIIYLTLFINMHPPIHIESLAYSLAPILLINAISLRVTSKIVIYSGDLLMLAAISISLPPEQAAITSLMAISLSSLASGLLKRATLPMLPILTISFLITHAIYNY